ncbi:hypothetical protein [Wolbachia endosymbiont of Mansonella ozzardi]|nr:hypothetical protein [Wolbachia endosymbiont of Mansonella ozzardi]
MVRIAGNDRHFAVGGIAFGYDTNQRKDFAFAAGLSCSVAGRHRI